MNWGKLAFDIVSRIAPPAADWLADKLTKSDKPSKAEIAEANRHATQSGSARNASSAATQILMKKSRFGKNPVFYEDSD